MSFFALKGFEKLQFLLQQNPFPPGKKQKLYYLLLLFILIQSVTCID